LCRSVGFGEAHQWAQAHFLVSDDFGSAVPKQLAENMAFDKDKLREIAERVAGSSGLEVVEIEFLGSGKHRMLRVYIASLAPLLTLKTRCPAARTCSKFRRLASIAS
jgi:hypothetical protein